jgi:AAA+ ATPase superfamily predicted ATPase
MAGLYNITIPLAGRHFEQKKMRGLLKTPESEMLALLGRRRVGKTFLIKKVYENEMLFHLTGIQDVSRKLQLENFIEARNNYFPKSKKLEKPTTWIQAFSQLKILIGKPTNKKRVLFFDELPWLASGSTEFLKAFDHFWNAWAVDQHLVVVICGSATSWMITNIINHKGGLHNRVTQTIHLQPFTLLETEQYFEQKKIQIPRYSLIQLYMAFGGIPYYLKEVKRGQSVIQVIDQTCFGKQANLYGEFDNLYKALFKNHKKYVDVIRALSKKWKGLSRDEIIQEAALQSGGAVSTILRELEECSFIKSYVPFGKKERDTLYRLTDEYSLFYLRFIEKNKIEKGFWIKKYNTPTVKTWQGYAFETICIKHIEGVKNALGISGIYTQEVSFLKRADAEMQGCQIDMLIDRADSVINICEMKFYDGLYTITSKDITDLQHKKNTFQRTTKTKKQLFVTMITTHGIQETIHKHYIDKEVTMDALFI